MLIFIIHNLISVIDLHKTKKIIFIPTQVLNPYMKEAFSTKDIEVNVTRPNS